MNIIEESQVSVSRAVFEGNRDDGIFAYGEGTSVSLSDVVISGTLVEDSTQAEGDGMSVREGADLTAERLAFFENHFAGLIIAGSGTTATISDLTIEGTLSQESDGRFGRGLDIESGAEVELTRALISGNRGVGLAVFGSGTQVTATDLVVDDTIAPDCSEEGCTDEGGIGIAAVSEAAIDVTRFTISDNLECGVQVVLGQVDLHHGTISGNPIGANIQSEGFDVQRLMDEVNYENNQISQDTSALFYPASID